MISLIRHRKLHRRLFEGIASIVFGGGLGLLVDKIGLLLTRDFGLKGNYWAPQSYYAILAAPSIFALFLFFYEQIKR